MLNKNKPTPTKNHIINITTTNQNIILIKLKAFIEKYFNSVFKKILMIVKRCPVCKSAKINLYAGALTGQYHCEKCGYLGVLVIEEDIKETSK